VTRNSFTPYKRTATPPNFYAGGGSIPFSLSARKCYFLRRSHSPCFCTMFCVISTPR